MSNSDLNKAGTAKSDEFYTLTSDIEAEIQHYLEEFKGKVVLCNCDDPLESNFVRYFLNSFDFLNLKGIIATGYAESKLAQTMMDDDRKREFIPDKGRGYGAVITTGRPMPWRRVDRVDIHQLLNTPGNKLFQLNGDGDFRSPECIDMLTQADIVVTNPPFSLFREYIAQLIEFEKKFLIIGNLNALTYKEVFPLFRDGKLWLGCSIHSGDRKFYVPDDYPLKAAGCGIDKDGRRFIRVKGVRWFTNMKGDLADDRLSLFKRYDKTAYKTFENYDAINVNRTRSIPYDYSGYMGVPITFLDYYSPKQFEILMLANGNARTNTDPGILRTVGYRHHPKDKGGVGIIDGKRTYVRVLVRNRHPSPRGLVSYV